jgi:hypothetical protein
VTIRKNCRDSKPRLGYEARENILAKVPSPKPEVPVGTGALIERRDRD